MENDFSIDQKIETVSKNIWTLYKCTNVDGCPLSIFLYDLTAPLCKFQFVENSAKYLKVLQHPNVLKFHALSHSSKEAWLVTEHVTPLETLLESLTADEILTGLCDVIEALSFLHDRKLQFVLSAAGGGLCHNNFNVSSVFVADDGTWKLGAMEFVCPFPEASSTFLNQHRVIRSEKAIAPEERLSATDQKQTSGPGYSRDVFAFGVFAEHMMAYLSDLGDRLNGFRRIIQNDLLNVDPSERPQLNVLLNDSLFRTEFIEICGFLKQITVKTADEKRKFFGSVVEKLYRLPQQLVATRLVKPLLSRFVVLDDDACEQLIPHLLTPIAGNGGIADYEEGQLNPVLSEPLFRRYVIPEIHKIFHVHDAHIRSVLLRHFHQYVRMFERTALADVIFPQILLSLRDANDDLVMLSLQAIALLVPILGGDVVVGADRPKIFYEGISKFAAINGHVNVIPNGVSVLQENHSVLNRSNTDLTYERNTPSSSGGTVDAKQKREDAWKRMEERRRKRKKERKCSDTSRAVTRDEEPGVLGSNVASEESEPATQEESLKDGAKTPIEAVSSPAPLSPSYERTDSKMELEIEAEKTATASLGMTDHDSRLTATVDWSDVSRERVSADQSSPKQAKGRLKLTIDSGGAPSPSHHVESGGRGETGIVIRLPPTVQKKTDDGWEDFENVIPKPSSAFSGGEITSSTSAKGSLSLDPSLTECNLEDILSQILEDTMKRMYQEQEDAKTFSELLLGHPHEKRMKEPEGEPISKTSFKLQSTVEDSNKELQDSLKKLQDSHKKLQDSHKKLQEKLREDIAALSMQFRQAEDRMQKKIDDLKKDNECKRVVVMLKDFDDIQKIANKINSGVNGWRSLNLTEQLTIKHLSQKRHIGDGIAGLLACQNGHCHHAVSQASMDQCRRLSAKNNVFAHFCVKGQHDEITQFIRSTNRALKTVKNFMYHNPNFGTSVHVKSGRSQLTWKGKYRR